jgi:hypothetical protein
MPHSHLKLHTMKYVLCLCLFMAFFIIAPAQMYDSALRYRLSTPTFEVAADTLIARAMADPTDTTEGGPANSLKKWKHFMGSRISTDVPTGGDMYAPYGLAMGAYMSTAYCAGISGYTGNWSCTGPFTNTYGYSGNQYDPGIEHQGRVNALWVSPYDTSIILAGADEGG